MKHLFKSYQIKLKKYQEDMNQLIREGDDVLSIIKLTIKIKCYSDFLSDMREVLPPEKPVDPKMIEKEIKAKEESDKKWQEERDDWNRRMLAGEFDREEKEIVPPEFE